MKVDTRAPHAAAHGVPSTAPSRVRRLRTEVILALGVLLISGWSQVEAGRAAGFGWDERRYSQRARSGMRQRT